MVYWVSSSSVVYEWVLSLFDIEVALDPEAVDIFNELSKSRLFSEST